MAGMGEPSRGRGRAEAVEEPVEEQPGAEPGERISTREVECLLEEAGEYFQGEEPIFTSFKDLLRSWNKTTGTTDSVAVLWQIKWLLREHRHMLEIFNEALPPECKLVLPPSDLPAEYPYMVGTFLRKLEARLDDTARFHSTVYEMFDYYAGTGTASVREDLSAVNLVHLLDGNHDMLGEFALLVSEPPPISPTAEPLPVPPVLENLGDSHPVHPQPAQPAQPAQREDREGPSNPRDQSLQPNSASAPILGPGGGMIGMVNNVPDVDMYVQQDEEEEFATRALDKAKGKMVVESVSTDPPQLRAGTQGTTSNEEANIYWATGKYMMKYTTMLIDSFWTKENNNQKPPILLNANQQRPPNLMEYFPEEQAQFFREFYGDQVDSVLKRLSYDPIAEFPKIIQEVLSQKRPDRKGKDVIILSSSSDGCSL